jgi:hypothetical protein
MTRNEILARYPHASASFIRANLSADDAGPIAKLERNPGNAPLAAKEVQRPTGNEFLVRIVSRRKRLLDQDNLCEKYIVDLLRYCGAITDDSPEQTQIQVAQTKCRKGEAEEITIEVFRVNKENNDK